VETRYNQPACAENLSHQVSAQCAIPTLFVDYILTPNKRRYWCRARPDGNQVFSVTLKTQSLSVKKPQLTDSPENQFKSVPVPSPYAYQMALSLLRAYWAGYRLALPALWAVVLILPLCVAISRVAFNFRVGYGLVCTGSPDGQLNWLANDGKPLEAPKLFDTKNPCWASGLGVEQGAAYRLTLEVVQPWFDQQIMTDIGGFKSDKPQRALLFTLFQRWPSAGWFAPIARIGGDGDAEWPLVSNDKTGPLGSSRQRCTHLPYDYDLTNEYCVAHGYDGKWEECRKHRLNFATTGTPLPSGELKTADEAWHNSGAKDWTQDGYPRFAQCASAFPRTVLQSDFVAKETGELFLFVNDAMPILGLWGPFYDNNTGTAKVTLQRMTTSALATR
jgi:hypothetical protein